MTTPKLATHVHSELPDNQNFTLSAEWAEWWNMDRRPLTLVSRSVPQQDRSKSNTSWGGVGMVVFGHVCAHSAARQTGNLKAPVEREEGRKWERGGSKRAQKRDTRGERWTILKWWWREDKTSDEAGSEVEKKQTTTELGRGGGTTKEKDERKMKEKLYCREKGIKKKNGGRGGEVRGRCNCVDGWMRGCS